MRKLTLPKGRHNPVSDLALLEHAGRQRAPRPGTVLDRTQDAPWRGLRWGTPDGPSCLAAHGGQNQSGANVNPDRATSARGSPPQPGSCSPGLPTGAGGAEGANIDNLV